MTRGDMRTFAYLRHTISAAVQNGTFALIARLVLALQESSRSSRDACLISDLFSDTQARRSFLLTSTKLRVPSLPVEGPLAQT